MIIGFDANEANVERRVGTGQYALAILNHLIAIASDDQFTLYLKNLPLRDLPQATQSVNYHIFGPKPLWTQFALPLHLYFGKRPDVFFSPAHYAPRFCPVPSVITLHDTSYFTHPDYFLKKDLEQLKNWTAYSVKQAKAIIVPSQSTKQDVMKYYHYPEEKIYVITHGFDKSRFFAPQDSVKIKLAKQTYGISGNYLLYLGTLQPRKNINTLIDAYALLTNLHGLMPLVIAGKKGWLFEEIFVKVKTLGLEQSVMFTDFIHDEDVPLIYAGATLYILPSLYEGFGLPILEAMACGTPVAASNTSSLPEVIGPGMLFDPSSADEIAKTIQHFLSLPDAKKSALRKACVEFVHTFSWDKTAQQTLTVLHTAAQTP